MIHPVAIECLLECLLLGRIPFPCEYLHVHVRLLDLLLQVVVSVTDRSLDVLSLITENTLAERHQEDVAISTVDRDTERRSVLPEESSLANIVRRRCPTIAI